MRIRRGLLIAVALLFGSGLAHAEPKKIATVEGITEYRLDNGMQVLLFPDASRPTVTVNLTVFVGSRHEGYGETGMAHLLEHMVFKGTPTHPHIPKSLSERGAQFNGTTSYDRTNYFETLPASDANLEFAIRLEADRLVNSFIKREDLVSEMTVVRNEFESGENSPASVLFQRIMATAYEWHNYGKTTIGNRSDIERVPIENLQAFYRRFYQPDNAMVVIAGKFDEKKALELVQKYFGAIPRPKRQLDKTYTEEPPQDGERLVMLRRVGDVGVVGVAYHVPAGPHADFPAVQVLEDILTNEPSGRLYKALVESKKATSVGGFAQPLHDPGAIIFTAQVPKGQSIEETRDLLLSTIENLATKGVTEEEVRRAKLAMLKQREQAAANTSRLAVNLSEWAAQGDWRLYFLHRDRLEKVTPEDVKRVAEQYLRRNNRTVGMFLPTEKAERVAIPETPKVPALVANYTGRDALVAGEAFDATHESIDARSQVIKLPHGLKGVLLPKKTRGEEVQLQLTLRYGKEDELKDLLGATGFLGDLMVRGTKQLSYQQLQDELDKQKTTLRSGTGGFGRGGRGMMLGGGGPGAVTFSMQTKRDHLPAALELFRQVLREPALPEADFDVLKRERLARLESSRTDPMMLGANALSRKQSPYPPTDIRYVPTIDEQIARLKATQYKDVIKLHEEFVGAQNGELSIVGDFDPAQVKPLLEKMFSGWQASRPYERIATPTPPGLTGDKQSINTPDKANAAYMAALSFPMRDDDPDYPALLMANYVLGGGSLSSRLADRVRQKEGLSYTVASMFRADAFDPNASFMIFAISNPQNVQKVDRAIQEELDLLLKNGVTEEELARAKSGYLEQQRISRTNDGALAGTLGQHVHRGRTMAFQKDLEKKIQALTVDEVSAAFRKYVDPKKLVIVTAGDFGKAGSE
jgi:zinc protease